MKQKTDFKVFDLSVTPRSFDSLTSGVDFELFSKGRKAVNLVNATPRGIPLVRTTMKCSKPNQQFSPTHKALLDDIRRVTGCESDFNSALIEVYNNDYRKMSYHSDMALDLHPDSYICLYSGYDNPHTTNVRSLVVQDKQSREKSVVKLFHQSLVLFSVSTNGRYVHKIILQEKCREDVQWLGITFRLSKTFITFRDEIPYFVDLNNTQLHLADEKEIRELFKQRSLENREVNYVYSNSSDIHFTLSPGDAVGARLRMLPGDLLVPSLIDPTNNSVSCNRLGLN